MHAALAVKMSSSPDVWEHDPHASGIGLWNQHSLTGKRGATSEDECVTGVTISSDRCPEILSRSQQPSNQKVDIEPEVTRSSVGRPPAAGFFLTPAAEPEVNGALQVPFPKKRARPDAASVCSVLLRATPW